MDFYKMSDKARKVMALAHQEAQRFNHPYIGTEHILLGLAKAGFGVAADVLKQLDVDLRKIRPEVEKLIKSGPAVVSLGKLTQTPRAKKVIAYAIEEARQLKHNYLGTEHLLLGLLREHDGVAAQVLMNLGLKLEEVRNEVLALLGGEHPQAVAKAAPSNKITVALLKAIINPSHGARDLRQLLAIDQNGGVAEPEHEFLKLPLWAALEGVTVGDLIEAAS